ncbi:MAG: ABC transporter substrate-binding protein [Ruminococcaceae bacterium]|nr:ABC transporter substrate-binding protein [Oscillospiraceae bacterium]
MKKKVFALATVLVMALSLVLTGCGGGTSSTGGGTSTGGASTSGAASTGGGASTDDGGGTAGNINVKDEIVVALPQIVAKLDPQYGAAMWEWTVNINIYDTLWRTPKNDYRNEEQINWMVDDYTVADDNLSWTITLRDDLLFHDGSKFTSEDAKFSIDRMGTSPYTMASMEWVDNVEVVDDLTFIIHMKYTFPLVKQLLADYQYAMCSKNAIETYGEGSREAIVGTGPYKLVEWTADNNITLEYFEDHFAPEPAIKKVTYRAIPDYSSAAIAMRSGEVDLMNYGLATDILGFIEDTENFDTARIERDHTQGMTFNNQVAPFNDVRIRQAVNHAIDKEAVNLITDEGLSNTENTKVKTFPTMEGYSKALNEGRLTVYEYDVDKAKALLAEAGYDENNPMNVPYITPSSAFAQSLAAALQAQLSVVNINLDIEVMEPSAWINRVAEGDFVCGFNDTGAWGNRSALSYHWMYHTGAMYAREHANIARVDEITETGLRTLDAAEREELYAELLEIVSAEAICVPVMQRVAYIVTVKGLNAYAEPMMLPIAIYDCDWDA